MYKEKRLILLIVLKVESPTLGSPTCSAFGEDIMAYVSQHVEKLTW
jgi:hypothetical protein